MPIYGYMQTRDPGRISTINTVDGDLSRRRKLIPPLVRTNQMYVTMYVADCLSHEPRGAVVPVVLKGHQEGKGWVELGKAWCCPLCWVILKTEDGLELPEPKPQELPVARTLEEGLRRKKKPRTRSTEDHTKSQLEAIKKLAADKGQITVYETMALNNLSRTRNLKLLAMMVKFGWLVKKEQARPYPTLYFPDRRQKREA